MKDDWTALSYKKRKVFTMELLRTYGWVCCICGLPITPGTESVQHIPPRSKGGYTSIKTCRPAHRSCNYQLQDKPNPAPGTDIHNGLDAFN